MNTYKSAEFAKLAAVSVKTLQRWDQAGQLKPTSRTPGNRRLYTHEQLNTLLNRRPVQDLMLITDSFSARLTGLRNYRQAVKQALHNDQGTPDTPQPQP